MCANSAANLKAIEFAAGDIAFQASRLGYSFSIIINVPRSYSVVCIRLATFVFCRRLILKLQ